MQSPLLFCSASTTSVHPFLSFLSFLLSRDRPIMNFNRGGREKREAEHFKGGRAVAEKEEGREKVKRHN